jgi:hypothetical protein
VLLLIVNLEIEIKEQNEPDGSERDYVTILIE